MRLEFHAAIYYDEGMHRQGVPNKIDGQGIVSPPYVAEVSQALQGPGPQAKPKTNILKDIMNLSDGANKAGLAQRLSALKQELNQAVDARLPGLGSGVPTLLGASKGQTAPTIEVAIGLGMTDFGENRVQEAQAKWPGLKAAHPKLRLHLIGPLQSNKAKEAVALFDVIQTVDRPKIADAIALAAKALGRNTECFIQVNTGEEAQKGGVAPRDLTALLAHCKKVGLDITGLMAIPPAEENPAPHFALLKKLAGENGLTQLSMGMSHDFALATRLGATCVRIGTRLFGPRTE